MTLGPHIGLVRFAPHWSGGSDVELSGSTGLTGGLAFTAGSKVASFSLSLDYLDASFDVETSNGWVANNDTLDISGYALNMGVIFNF